MPPKQCVRMARVCIVLARENQQKPCEQVAKQIHIEDSTESLTKLPIGDF